MATKSHNSDADFNTKLLAKIGYLFGTTTPNATEPATIPGHATRLTISAANMTALWALFFLWSDYYPKSKDPLLTNKPTRDNKNDTRTSIELLWRTILGDMKKSALTNEDRIALDEAERDSEPTDIRAAAIAPQITFEPSIHGVHSIRFINPEDPESLALPEGQNIFLEKFVGDANLEDDAVPFNKSDIVTKHLFNVQHAEGDTGKTAYYRPFFITATGKKGVAGQVRRMVIN